MSTPVGHPIEERLRGVLRERSSDELQYEAEGTRIDELISRAASEVPEDASEEQYARAEANFRRILDEAEREARERGAPPTSDEVLDAVMITLCPIWPFC